MGRGMSRRTPALRTSTSYRGQASSSSGGSSSKTAGSDFDADELRKDHEDSASRTSASYGGQASSSSRGSSSKTAGSEFDSYKLWKDHEGAVETEDVAPGTSSRPSALRTSALRASQHSKKRALAPQAVQATFAKPAEGDRILVLQEKYLCLVLAGSKSLEIRSMRLKPRRVWLGNKGLVYGEASIVGAVEVCSDAEWQWLWPQHHWRCEKRPYKQTFAMRLSNVKRCHQPWRYTQPRGAIGIVRYRAVCDQHTDSSSKSKRTRTNQEATLENEDERRCAPRPSKRPATNPHVASATKAETAADKRRKELDLWSLKALAEFEQKLEDPLVERLSLIPARLRASAGLPYGDVQEADIAAELERHSETMRSLHEETKRHWLSKAENFTNERHKFHLDEEMAHTGILTKLAENDKVPPEVNAERLQELYALEKWEDVEEDEVADIQKEILTSAITVADAIALFDAMHEIVLFAAGRFEPKAKQMKDALQRIPKNLREGLALSKPKKYRAIKNKEWRKDLSTILAVAFASLSAYWEG